MKKLILLLFLLTSLFANSQTEFWATTRSGGVNNMGTIFKTDGFGNNSTLQYNFENTTGGIPEGSLMQASDGKLYGLTTIGALSYGVLFQIDPITNVYTKKINFNDLSLISTSNATPFRGDNLRL